MITRRQAVSTTARYGVDFIQTMVDSYQEVSEFNNERLTSSEYKIISVFYKKLEENSNKGALGIAHRNDPIKNNFQKQLEVNGVQLAINYEDDKGNIQNYNSYMETTFKELAYDYYGITTGEKLSGKQLANVQKITRGLQSKIFNAKYKAILKEPFTNSEGKLQHFKFITISDSLFKTVQISDKAEGDLESDVFRISFNPIFTSYLNKQYYLMPSDIAERLEFGFNQLSGNQATGKRQLAKLPQTWDFIMYMGHREREANRTIKDDNKKIKTFNISKEKLLHLFRLSDKYFKRRKKAIVDQSIEKVLNSLVQSKILSEWKWEEATVKASPKCQQKLVYTIVQNWYGISLSKLMNNSDPQL